MLLVLFLHIVIGSVHYFFLGSIINSDKGPLVSPNLLYLNIEILLAPTPRTLNAD